MKSETSYECWCEQIEYSFDYHGILNALCGKTMYQDENGEWKGDYFKLQRMTVIQMIEMTYEEKLKTKLTKIKALAESGSENESIVAQNLLKKLTEIYGVDLNFATEEIYTLTQ